MSDDERLATDVAAAEKVIEAALRADPDRAWRCPELISELHDRWPATVAMIALHDLLDKGIAVANTRWFVRLATSEHRP